jgi:preprotein translocase subunit SecA
MSLSALVSHQVRKAVSLHVIGTDRYEFRWIDNQLRGRGCQQGDPSSTSLLLSPEDYLLRISGAESVTSLMNAFRLEDGLSIHSRIWSC